MSLRLKVILFFTLCSALAVLSLCFGSSFISPARVFHALAGDGSSAERAILLSLRVPRLVLALVVGASLSVSGALFQALLKNPLSDPYTIGVSGGAALGATVAILLSLKSILIMAFAFAGGIAVITLVFFLSRRIRLGSTSLILGGIAVSFILSSAVLLIFALARAEQVQRAMYWLMGDFSLARYAILWRAAVFSAAVIIITFFYHRHLDIISFGDAFAKNLGVRERDIVSIFWIASLLSAVSVSLAGMIGFVGLVIPHTVRYIFGPDHRTLLPASALGGGLFLALCDAAGRSIAPPYEIPAGIITGFGGGIFFLVLLLRKGGARS